MRVGLKRDLQQVRKRRTAFHRAELIRIAQQQKLRTWIERAKKRVHEGQGKHAGFIHQQNIDR